MEFHPEFSKIRRTHVYLSEGTRGCRAIADVSFEQRAREIARRMTGNYGGDMNGVRV
jgi:hypothetical protein